MSEDGIRFDTSGEDDARPFPADGGVGVSYRFRIDGPVGAELLEETNTFLTKPTNNHQLSEGQNTGHRRVGYQLR